MNTIENDTVRVVNKRNEGLLHIIKNENETECGESYTIGEVEERPVDDAGVWCMDCMGVEFEEVDTTV